MVLIHVDSQTTMPRQLTNKDIHLALFSFSNNNSINSSNSNSNINSNSSLIFRVNMFSLITRTIMRITRGSNGNVTKLLLKLIN